MNTGSLLSIISPCTEENDTELWLRQRELFDFLQEQRSGRSIMLYGTTRFKPSFLFHSILVPAAEIDDAGSDELIDWRAPSISWSCDVMEGGGKPPSMTFDIGHFQFGDKPLKNDQRLVFPRSFSGREEDKDYFEIAQFLTHAHELHWIPERRAWCRFNEHGDIDKVIHWLENDSCNATCICIDRNLVEKQMSASGTLLVQVFESTRKTMDFQGWDRNGEEWITRDDEKELYYRTYMEQHASRLWGTQIVRPSRTAEQLGIFLKQRETQPKHYESFITFDYKNKRIAEVNCGPESTVWRCNESSPLPSEVSPVFFRADVLEKYKSDPDKYQIEDDESISCRDVWYLPFHVNPAGQIQTYLKDLRDLPHSEQRYWRSFNEEPRAEISRRAYVVDVEGEVYEEPDHLRDLKAILGELRKTGVQWFRLRDSELVKQIHYPLTNSNKAWGDVLGLLSKVVVEGLKESFFKGKAKKSGVEGDPKWGSVRWLQEAMKADGVDNEVINEVVRPLDELRKLRNKLSAHSEGSEAAKLRKDLRRQHTSPHRHIEHLCGQLLRTLRTLQGIYPS